VGLSILERARTGDERAFGELTTPYRRELKVHCYRMLGSLVDAEDLLQETLIAAWRGLDTYAGRSSLRAWLYRIATNRCLNAIRDNKRHRPAEPVPPFDPPRSSRLHEVSWLQPYPDDFLEVTPGPAQRYAARESVELAFVTALQLLPPRQTAVLLLYDVLGFSTAEVAAMVDTSPTAVKGALQRARRSLSQRQPIPRTRPSAGKEQELAERFARAFSADDVQGVIELLTDDAWLAMPPAPHEYHGTAAIAGFLRVSADSRPGEPFALVPVRANNQPAFACFMADLPAGILVLTIAEDGITAITRFLDPDLHSHFEISRT
jgi:RNA polymerase sigma-70 factor (ECF subfamily)